MKRSLRTRRGTLFALGTAAAVCVTSAHAAPPANNAFADQYAAWQRLVSSNAAYRAAAPDLSQAPADPVDHPASTAARRADFADEESAWQAESRSDAPSSPVDRQAATSAIPSREPLAQRIREFSDTERVDQQLVSGNATYKVTPPAASPR